MRKVPVSLSDIELKRLWVAAVARNKNKDAHNIATKKVDEDLSDLEMHYIGMKAEYAVSKLLGTEFNTENTLAGDGGKDFKYYGLSVDVKYSQLDLKVKPGTFKSDIVILTQPLRSGVWRYAGETIRAEVDTRIKKDIFAWKHILVVGWIDREAFEKEHVIRNFGYNDVEFMPVYKLKSLEDLKAYADKSS